MPHRSASINASDVIGRVDVVGHGICIIALRIRITLRRIVVAVLFAELHVGVFDLAKFFRLHFDFVVSSPVHRQRLVDQEGVVERMDEQFLRSGQPSALGSPVVRSDPGLRSDPENPNPGVLVVQSRHYVATVGTFEKQMRRNGLGEHAGVAHSQSAESDEQNDGRRNGQIDGQCESQSLDADLASEFAGQETAQSSPGLNGENVGGRIGPSCKSFRLSYFPRRSG